MQVPPLLELLDELELLEELLELLLDEELEELEFEAPELEDELEELLVPPPLIAPAEAVRVTRSILAPSSRRRIRSVWAPAARLLKVAGAMVL